ncbi:MAG: PstS family phosphate ABC transporter substrate-binding protein [Anaerolineales bacterium]|nr:PstS family phosphate ABC transporter substrate-binding protein [Anaerolineales bacterium]
MKSRPFLTLLRVSLAALSMLILTGCQATSAGTDPVSQELEIENKGSDTIVNLALAWAESYQEIAPEIRISVTGGGSGTGIAALINGTVDIANASRRIKPEEFEAAVANGIEPMEYIIARDAIAIVVHRDNPVNELSLQQISDIYSGAITNWQQIGGEDRPIVLLSRETNSGTHIFFLEEVLRLGEVDNRTLFSPATLLLPSSEGISAEIRQNPNAIGYDGLGYVTEDMKIIAVSVDDSSPYILPNSTTVLDNTYPIARDLYMYTAGVPADEIADYIRWILSEDAQSIVSELGFVPVSP